MKRSWFPDAHGEMDELAMRGYVLGGAAELSASNCELIDRLVRARATGGDGWTAKHGIDDAWDKIEDEVEIVTLVEDDVVHPAFAAELDVEDLWKPRWSRYMHARSGALVLSRAQLHMHNLVTDGPVHVDAERTTVRLWNVFISLYDDKACGFTAVYPPTVTEAQVGRGAIVPDEVCVPSGDYFVLDANTFHQRRGGVTTADAARRLMLVLTFADGVPTGVGW